MVREVERVATSEQDKPEHPCIVDDCGELPAGTNPTAFLQQVVAAAWCTECEVLGAESRHPLLPRVSTAAWACIWDAQQGETLAWGMR